METPVKRHLLHDTFEEVASKKPPMATKTSKLMKRVVPVVPQYEWI